jgi:siroheme synthase (precorrin-2 oxidase/ferrochelatase)
VAKFLRQKIDVFLEPAYGDMIRLAAAARSTIAKLPKDKRAALWSRIASDAFLDQIRKQGPERAEAQLKEWMDEFSC